ncbi:creatininase family protein [Niallia oryzisoli]|uniref:Creatininase family protein n=1 Tax=Niallia oryzisoli TaxID=1737571 RepID=A0ABZ2CA45_9BACI
MINLLNPEPYQELMIKDKKFAVLPVGSCEQHGHHLPLITDTLIASLLSKLLAERCNGLLLPPITYSCSHEHASFFGTISISAETLIRMIKDIYTSLNRSNINQLIIVNGHGGNYVLSNLAQELNIDGPKVMLFPTDQQWKEAKVSARIETPKGSSDMHGGELETSILLQYFPEFVSNENMADVNVQDRTFLHLFGINHYTDSGIIGFPTLATAEKGRIIVEAIVSRMEKDVQKFFEGNENSG